MRVAHRYAARFFAMIAAGGAVGLVSALSGAGELSFVLGWAAASFVYVAWVWVVIGGMDAENTANHAVSEDPMRGVAEVLILVATVASLAAIGTLLVDAGSSSHSRSGELAGLAVISVALSWLLIHTLFTLRYARLYFDGEPGGIDFNTDDPPRYVDFAYVSFSVGMTFQISDTNLKTSGFRSSALRHALLSYVFGTVVVATTINLVVSVSSS